ncbi:hypothetical protein E2C01_019203 [Portunus trituberculatus]|uniref:Uncharacterized protein n=1 Tax=Portunus trituberculatus TaxID=210409 RepID=A0A5B7DYL8_PORTR|nr:hypothetical protein [Portunus trituberculatus]
MLLLPQFDTESGDEGGEVEAVSLPASRSSSSSSSSQGCGARRCVGVFYRGSAWHASVSGGARHLEGRCGVRGGGGSGCGRAGGQAGRERQSRAGGGQCGGGPGSVKTGWLPRAHGSQGSDGSPAAARDAALPEGRRTMGWLPAPTRRPPPLPSSLSLLLGFLFLVAVVLPSVTAEPEPDPKPQQEDYYDYGKY